MKRLKFLTAIVLLFFIASFLRLFQKQILEHQKYTEAAKGQQVIKKEILPKRGRIYVREGKDLYPLATNMTLYSVSVIPKHLLDKKEAAKKLSSVLSLNEKELYQKINNDKPYLPPLAREVDENKAKEIKSFNLPGVYLEEEDIRSYPEGEIAAHILGFVNAEGKGQYGLEGFYDNQLRGEKGLVLGEKDLRGRLIYLFGKDKSLDGIDLILTIDRSIQYMAEQKIKEAVEKFKAISGSIVIIDPQSGTILALVNYPTFDPNKYKEIKDYNLFQNSVIGKSWEPGSVFKVITMAAGIDSNKISKETTEYFDASIRIGGYEIWTFDKKPHGQQNMTQVLETSNNVGMVHVVQKVGKELFYKYLDNFGFGSSLGIDLDKETPRSLRPWKSWKEVELATMGFGQGIAITPLQLTTAVSAIANGGKIIRPHIVDEMVSPDGKQEKVPTKEIKQVISPAAAATVSEMMVSVVEKGHGKKAGVSGYKVAGKTGTAQVPKQDAKGYEEEKTIGSFVGFAPAENPRFVMLVKIDEPKTVEWAESSAAPVFGEIANWLLKSYFQVPPSE